MQRLFPGSPTRSTSRPRARRLADCHYSILESRQLLAVNFVPDGTSKTFSLQGDATNQTVIILDVPGVTASINIDSDGDGALDMFLDSKLFFGIPEFDHFQLDLGGGEDRIEYRLLNHLQQGQRTIEASGSGNGLELMVDTNGFDLIDSSLRTRLRGSSGNDFYQGVFDDLTRSTLQVENYFQAGTDQYFVLLRGALTDSNIDSLMSGGDGVDTENVFIQRQCSLTRSDLNFVAYTHAGNDAVSVSIGSQHISEDSSMRYVARTGEGQDALNFRLNGGVSHQSRVVLDGHLGSGNDSFVSTLGYDGFVNDSSGEARFGVDAGSGDDSLLVMPFTLTGNDALINGTVVYQLSGNAGNDTMTFGTQDAFGQTFANVRVGATGLYEVSLQGNGGHDLIQTTFDFDAASQASGRVRASVQGNGGQDRVRFWGSDPAGLDYGPNQGILFNGGSGQDEFQSLFNDPQGQVPLNKKFFEVG